MDEPGLVQVPVVNAAHARSLFRHNVSALINPTCKCLVAQACALVVTSVLLFISPFAKSVDATEFDLQFGHWAGELERDDYGTAVACTVSVHNDDEEMLLIRVDRTDSISMGVFEADWDAPKVGFIEVIIMVDHELIHTGGALLLKDDTMFIRSLRRNSLSAIGAGQFLSVTSGERSVLFDLKGSDRAVEFLDSCEPAGGESDKES